MKIAIVASGSPLSVWAWSGIPYYVMRELSRRYGDVVAVETPRLDAALNKLSKLRRVGLFPPREPMVTAAYTRIITREVERIGADLIVSVGAPHKVADLPPQWPVVHVDDIMYGTIVDYYPRFRNLSARTRRIGDSLQLRVIQRARALLLSSDWAAREAAVHYGVPLQRFTVAPFGANLSAWPALAPPRSNTGPLRLLFVGYEWHRKGGPLAVDIFRQVRARLPDTELHIAGCTPAETRGEPGVVHHGLLHKTSPEEIARFERVFRQASLYFMPSQYEAFGLVYSEACAFGLPIVARDTGGVAMAVQDGRNGRLLPPSAPAEAYVEAIFGIWENMSLYEAMQRAARLAFESRLNWEAWGESFHAAVFCAQPAATAPEVNVGELAR